MLRAALSILGVLVAAAFLWLFRRRRTHELYLTHSITAQALHQLMESGEAVLLYDTRFPLDLLADAHIIPGARHVNPAEICSHPDLLPIDQDTVVYCTCPSDTTTERIVARVHEAGYTRVRFLRGGLKAWRDAGYPVRDYEEAFELNSAA